MSSSFTAPPREPICQEEEDNEQNDASCGNDDHPHQRQDGHRLETRLKAVVQDGEEGDRHKSKHPPNAYHSSVLGIFEKTLRGLSVGFGDKLLHFLVNPMHKVALYTIDNTLPTAVYATDLYLFCCRQERYDRLHQIVYSSEVLRSI